MDYRIYYGEISDDRLNNWDNGDDNPFNVLKKELPNRKGSILGGFL